MPEDLLSILLLKDAVYQVAAEQLQFNLASQGDVVRNLLVSLREDVAHHQSIGLLEI